MDTQQGVFYFWVSEKNILHKEIWSKVEKHKIASPNTAEQYQYVILHQTLRKEVHKLYRLQKLRKQTKTRGSRGRKKSLKFQIVVRINRYIRISIRKINVYEYKKLSNHLRQVYNGRKAMGKFKKKKKKKKKGSILHDTKKRDFQLLKKNILGCYWTSG